MAGNEMQLGLLLCLLLACLLASSESLTECSDHCESEFCADAPFLTYGRYCGVFYTGCNDEAPCDALDSRCKTHDHCVDNNGYLNVNCNENMLNCLSAYYSSGQPQFPGATCSIDELLTTIDTGIELGVWIGKDLPPLPPLAATYDFSTSTDVHGN